MPDRVLVLAPNWLGDAVMALPAIADVRRAFPSASLTVAARPGVLDVFRLAPFIDGLLSLAWRGRWWPREVLAEEVARVRAHGADLAILLPNSFASAWLVSRAAVRDRWGYRTDWRRRLLTRSVPRPPGSMHQGAYYQHLTRELGIDSGPLEPVLSPSEEALAAARGLLAERGWVASRPLVVFSPGAAYGAAKRWPPAYVARVISRLVRERHATCVIVGSAHDAATTAEIVENLDAGVRLGLIDLTGQTTIPVLAGVLAVAGACVSNDSGAMHLAAAVGTPLVAPFGPTNEYETAPLTREGRAATVLTSPVFCRPCMLRECPIDHRCMKRIAPDRVFEAIHP